MRFESGVKAYRLGVALVENPFPVDERDVAHECCEECFFYREASKTCGLNHKPCMSPSKFVGEWCPMIKVTDEQRQKLIEALAEIIGEEDG